jgi:hypothetical protein
MRFPKGRELRPEELKEYGLPTRDSPRGDNSFTLTPEIARKLQSLGLCVELYLEGCSNHVGVIDENFGHLTLVNPRDKSVYFLYNEGAPNPQVLGVYRTGRKL